MSRGATMPCRALRLRASRQRGFTLLETLVALVIAAAAAAVILSFIRTLMLRAEREQAHQLAVMQLLNDSVRAEHFRSAKVQTRLDGDTLLLEGQQDEGGLPQIRVRNFSVRGEKLPPISFAYTSFQLFIAERDRYAIHAASAALPSPVGGDARQPPQ